MTKRALVISYHYYPDSAVGAKRPSRLVQSMIEDGWQVDVITKKLTEDEESQRNAQTSFGSVYSVYQHPGILNPLWNRWKIWRTAYKLRPQFNGKEGEDRGIVRQAFEPKQVPETFSDKLKRTVFSLQAILSATKSWVGLALLCLIALKFKRKKYDLILSSSPTDSGHLLGLVAKKMFSAPWVIDIRDPLNLWEETDYETRTKFRYGVENRLEQAYYKYCDRMVVTSPSLARELSTLDLVDEQKVSTVYNGYDGNPETTAPPDSPPIKAIFAGSLYFKRNPIPLFEALDRLNKKGKIAEGDLRFDFYGDCDKWNGINLKEWIRNHELDCFVVFKGKIPPKELEELLPSYHYFINFAQDQPKQIPAKTFDYLRFRGCMIVITENYSDTGKLVNENHLGIAVAPESELIESILEQVIGESSFSVADIDRSQRTYFSRVNQNNLYLEILREETLNAKG